MARGSCRGPSPQNLIEKLPRWGWETAHMADTRGPLRAPSWLRRATSRVPHGGACARVCTCTRVPVPTHLHVCFRVCAWCARERLGLSVHVRVCYVCLHKHTLRTTRPDRSEGGLRKLPLRGQGWAFVDRVWRKVTRTRPGVWEAHGRRAQAQPHPEAPVRGAGGGEAGVALRSKERPAHRPAIGEGGGFL